MSPILIKITEVAKTTGYSAALVRSIFAGKIVKVGGERGRLYITAKTWEAFQSLGEDEKEAYRPSNVEGATKLCLVCKQLGISKCAAKQVFEAFKSGKYWYVKDADVEAFKAELPKQ